MTARTRFYSEVSICPPSPLEGEGRGGGYSILLDGKPILTPAGAALGVPGAPLAEAIAEEWRTQGEKIRPETMILTKLANTAIDRVEPDRQIAIAQILAFAQSELVCYRAESPQALADRQSAFWDPLLDWTRAHHGAKLTVTSGIGFVEQTPEALAALERAIADRDDFALSGLHAAATLLGSAVIALALTEGRLSAENAFAAAQLDEIYQAERWGTDFEAQHRSRKKFSELTEIARFLSILRK